MHTTLLLAQNKTCFLTHYHVSVVTSALIADPDASCAVSLHHLLIANSAYVTAVDSSNGVIQGHTIVQYSVNTYQISFESENLVDGVDLLVNTQQDSGSQLRVFQKTVSAYSFASKATWQMLS